MSAPADPDGTAPVAATFEPPPRRAARHTRTARPHRRQDRRRRGRLRRVLVWIAALMSATLLLTAVGGYVLFRHYEANVTRLAGVLRGVPGQDKPPPAPHDAQNFLLVGSDTRADNTPGDGFQGKGDDFVVGQRSDTVILAHVYGGSSDEVQLVSFPRDSLVTIPAYTNPKSGKTHPAERNKINQAFNVGGPQLLTATVERLTHVRVDHYVQVDFAGFQQMVDSLGGVDVCLSRPAKDAYSQIDLSAGRHHVNGKVALSFVRQRHGLVNGDIDRIKRQQQFLGAMVRKLLSAGTLANPFKLNGFLNIATSSIQADDSLDFSALHQLALRLRGVGAGDVVFTTIPVTTIDGHAKGVGSVVLIDKKASARLFRSIRDDVPPESPGPAPTPSATPLPASALTVPPSAIRVVVFNSSGNKRLGPRALADLTKLHYRPIGGVVARGKGLETTTVVYGPRARAAARTVAAAIPGSVLQLDPLLGHSRGVQILVGSSYDGAKRVKVVAGTPKPPRPSPTPTVITALDDPCAA